MPHSRGTIIIMITYLASTKLVSVQIQMPFYAQQTFPLISPSMLLNLAPSSLTQLQEKSENIAPSLSLIPVPVPMPVPVHLAVHGYAAPVCQNRGRQPDCPPCPPCVCKPGCTPAFFSYCSPCHQKCRCRSQRDFAEQEINMAPPLTPAVQQRLLPKFDSLSSEESRAFSIFNQNFVK